MEHNQFLDKKNTSDLAMDVESTVSDVSANYQTSDRRKKRLTILTDIQNSRQSIKNMIINRFISRSADNGHFIKLFLKCLYSQSTDPGRSRGSIQVIQFLTVHMHVKCIFTRFNSNSMRYVNALRPVGVNNWLLVQTLH